MSRFNRIAARLGLSIFTLLLAAFMLVGIASAHARLVSSNPGDGEVLTAEPTTVSAVYGEETSLTDSTFQVWFAQDASATPVQADNGDGKVDVNDRTKMSATLKPGLGDGIYTTKWHTVTEDDNGMVDGSFSFTVKSGATASGPTGATGTQQESGGAEDSSA